MNSNKILKNFLNLNLFKDSDLQFRLEVLFLILQNIFYCLLYFFRLMNYKYLILFNYCSEEKLLLNY
jgi:uncharacterized membrane protein YGL010W